MASREPRRPIARPGSRIAALALIGWVAGCAHLGGTPGPVVATEPPALLPENAVELLGRVRGPVSGIGDQADLHVFVRGDGAVWASIQRGPGPDGPGVHEILVWAEGLAMLFDRRSLRVTELGAEPGVIEAWGGRFVGEDALWLLGGRRTASGATTTAWSRRTGEWRGRREPANGLRRPAREPWAWVEAVWRDAEGDVHALRAQAESHRILPGGQAWPARLGLEGTDLAARVVVDWEQVRWHPALGDSMLDPLWEPARP